MNDAQYQAWLEDLSRIPYRVLLLEFDYGIPAGGTGTLRVGSQPYLSDTNLAYDDFIQNEPEIEDSLEDFLGVGDVTIANASNDFDWKTVRWRGYECRWLFGDLEWPIADFRRIATTMNAGCRPIGGNLHTFDLTDSGQLLNKTFLSADDTWTFSTKSTIDFIVTTAGLNSVTYYNVTLFSRDFQVYKVLTPETLVADSVRELASGIGAYTRISQEGQIEVFIPDTSSTSRTLTEDDIVYSEARQIEEGPAYQTVELTMGQNGPLSDTTNADTGDLDEKITIRTDLRIESEAQNILNDKVAYYSAPHPVWEFGVLDISQFLQVGDYIRVEHGEKTGEGLVSRIKRRPLSNFSRVEVTF